MITFGTIRLRHRSSIVDARNKIRGLADALGYDPIASTRLATAVSQASRVLLADSDDSRISVALDPATAAPRLIVDFEARPSIPRLSGISGFFDGMSAMVPRDGFGVLRASIRLPNPAFHATSNFVNAQRKRIQSQSREELIGDILVLLASPPRNVLAAVQGVGARLAGAVKVLAERESA